MESLVVKARTEGPDVDMALTHDLRRDIHHHVAAVRDPQIEPVKGAKGLPLGDITTFALGVLSSRATLSLATIIKSYLDKRRDLEIEIEGPKGRFHIKAADARAVDAIMIAGSIRDISSCLE